MTTIDEHSTIYELSEAEIDDYLSISFAISKGTANVSASDRKKLHPLMRHYGKMKHPFRACVRDNRKRFGAKTEAYCAVLKDLIVGSTKWRGKGKEYAPRLLSEEVIEDFKEFKIDFPEGFAHFLSELTEEEINNMIGEEETNLASGEVAWTPNNSYESIRRQVQQQLNNYPEGSVEVGYEYWVEDVSTDKEALVCYKGSEYYVVPFNVKKGGVTIAEEEDWKSVEKAYVESNYSFNFSDDHILAEMFFSGGGDAIEEDDLIWKSILREGTWNLSPGPGQTVIKKPIKVIKEGSSNPRTGVISMTELKNNFEAGIIEHVTVPTSHRDTVQENTGFIRKLRFLKDEEGREVLEAGIEFTEPDIKEKVKRGTIPNTSAGVVFGYNHKETGKRFNAVLGHAALTHRPWLNGMKPFGIEASEDLAVVSFSEEENETIPEENGGGEIVSTIEVEQTIEAPVPTFLDELGLSEDEVRTALAEVVELKAENKRNRIDSTCKAWQEEGKTPAVVKVAKELLMADEGSVAINLSEDGQTKTLSLSEVVERLVAASPNQNLTSEVVTEENTSGEGPEVDATNENDEANFSQEERAEIAVLMFDQFKPESEAIEIVKSKRNKTD